MNGNSSLNLISGEGPSPSSYKEAIGIRNSNARNKRKPSDAGEIASSSKQLSLSCLNTSNGNIDKSSRVKSRRKSKLFEGYSNSEDIRAALKSLRSKYVRKSNDVEVEAEPSNVSLCEPGALSSDSEDAESGFIKFYLI